MPQTRMREPPPLESNPAEDKRRKLKNVIQDVMRMQSLQRYLEPLIRKVVKEEIELAMKKHASSIKQNTKKDMTSTKSRRLQLHFLNNLSLPIFTGARIEGEDCLPIQIALVDAISGEIVISCPESSAKVEVVVLEGDFDGDDSNIWTLEEFTSNIVQERKGRKPLLTGDPSVKLKEGFGFVGEMSFTDNSSWTRSRRFRLGARVLGNIDGNRVREAKTESFIVRDHRGELYKKHHPPSLLDEVWRLEKIGKDGAFHRRLRHENIKTVKDFLIMLFTDPPRLRNILGTGMPSKMWEVTTEHAQTCVLGNRVYVYNPPWKNGVVFSVVGQMLGLLSESKYVPAEELSETERADARELVIAAFEHWEEVVSFDDEASLIENSAGSKLPSSPKMSRFYNGQANASSSDMLLSSCCVGRAGCFDEYYDGIENLDLRHERSMHFSGVLVDPMYGVECSNVALWDDVENVSMTMRSQSDLQRATDGFLLMRATGKAQTRWTKISSVLKWFSIRRIVVSRRSRVQAMNY